MSYISELVQSITAKYGTSDPFEICEAAGVMLMTEPLGSLKGLFTFVADSPVIILSPQTEREDRLLTCAHELGHFFLHSDIARENCLKEFEIFNMKDKVEYEANVFAAHLLIDEDEMMGYLREGSDVYETAMRLRVDPILLNLKLTELNSMGYRFDTGWTGTRLFV